MEANESTNGVAQPLQLKRIEIDFTLCRSLGRARMLEHFGNDAWFDPDEFDEVMKVGDGSCVQVFSGTEAIQVGEMVHVPGDVLTVEEAQADVERIEQMFLSQELEDGNWCYEDAEEAQVDLLLRALRAVANGAPDSRVIASTVLRAWGG